MCNDLIEVHIFGVKYNFVWSIYAKTQILQTKPNENNIRI